MKTWHYAVVALGWIGCSGCLLCQPRPSRWEAPREQGLVRERILIPQDAHPSPELDAILDYIWWAESRRGADPRCLPGRTGPAGEVGPWQVTSAWLDDCQRLWGSMPDPMDSARTRHYVCAWLLHYAQRMPAAIRPVTPSVWHQLYRRGPAGYRAWRAALPTPPG